MDTNLITLRTFSISYQHIFSDNRIVRTNLVEEIEDMFERDCKTIILEGKDGSGKTDILLQFAKKHSFDSVTFFINPAFRASFRQDYLMEDIGRQIYFFNRNEPAPEELEVTEAVFNKLTFSLTTSPGRKNKPVYFVLDALDQIEKSDFELLKTVLQNLPWSINNFYFLISGTIEKLKDLLPPAWLKNFKSLRVSRFTESETRQLFRIDDTSSNQAFLHEIHSTWKGHPESLSQVKRILDNGISMEEFLNNLDISEKNDLLEIEWKNANLGGLDLNSNKILIISILAFDDNIRSLIRIGSITGLSSIELNEVVSEISFLSVNDDVVTFVSNSYRQYAIFKLKRFERDTNKKLIDFYTTADDLNSILNLPTLFAKNNEWNNIVELLTIDNLDAIIASSRSFSDIKKQINHGYKAARSLKNSFDNIFRFSLHRSILIGLQSSDSQKDKIKSYISLNRPEDAFSVIANSVLKEDRLKMLIFFVQDSKLQKKNVDSSIIEEITDLLSEVDTGYLRENLMEIAVGLAHFSPTEAIQVIEKALNLKADNNSIEWLMGLISIIANQNRETTGEDNLKLETKEGKIITFVERFGKSLGFGINEVLPKDILEEIGKIDKPSDRIFLMRKWIQSNAESEEIFDIIDYTLNLVSQESSTIKPSTDTLYDIVFPIKYFRNPDSIFSMVKRIEDLMVTITAPTIGKIMLDTVIIESLLNVDVDEANNRSISLSNYINELSDVSIKLEAYANVWKMYSDIRKKPNIDPEHLLLDAKFIKAEIEVLVALFLNMVSDQDDEIQRTLTILATLDLAFALHIAGLLNTSRRRDSACQACIESYLNQDFDLWQLDDIEYAISQIASHKIKSEAIIFLFQRSFDLRSQVVERKAVFKDFLPFINSIDSHTARCRLISISIILLGSKQETKVKYLPKYDNLIDKLSSFLRNHYNKIDNPLKKIKQGFRLASALSVYNVQLASEYLTLAETCEKETTFTDITHLGALVESIRIMIRIYSGIIKKMDLPYDKITSLINIIPSKEDQVFLWAELSVRVYLAGKSSIANSIVIAKIIPVLDSYKKSNEKEDFNRILKASASALHLTQSANLVLYLNMMSLEQREKILPLVLKVLLSNNHESDPYDSLKGATHFLYQTAVEYLNLLELASNDALIHHYIRSLTKIVKANPNIFTRIQKGELYQKINNLIDKKLPNKTHGISHDGYLLSAKACAEHLNISGNEKVQQNFSQLESKIPNISSISDRAVTYMNLATEIEFSKKRKIELFKKAFEETAKISSVKERISMYEINLEIVSKGFLELFNHYLKIFEKDIYNLDENDQYPTFKKLIDLAYSCDKHIAQRLISNLDTDPAKKKMSEPASDHFEKLDLEKSAQSDYSQIGKIKERREKSNFAWNLLAQLNSDKRKVRDITETTSFIHSASTMPFFYSIPLYEFFIENIIKGDDKENLLLAFFESANANAKLCHNLICSISNKNQSALSYHIGTSNNSIMVNPGMQNDAYEFIKNFMVGTDAKNIYIIDPYFSEKDMHFLKKIDEWCYNSSSIVLSSCEASGDFSRSSYVLAWEDLSSELPPSNIFIRAKNQNNKSPFHDRYILLYDKKLGLRLGASVNGIDGKKTFEISKLLSTEVEAVYESIIKPFVYQRLREHADQSIKYESFDF